MSGPGNAMRASGQTCPARSLDVPPQVSYGAPMAILAGRHHLDTHCGRILLKTLRDGLVAQAGHDLTIEAAGWSGDLEVAADLTPVLLEVRVDLGSLVVREGTGGLKALTERDKQDIAATARKVLGAARHPDAAFSATSFQPSGPAGEAGGQAGASSPER